MLGRDTKELAAHWNACDLAFAEETTSLLEVDGGNVDALRDHAIGKSGHDIRLKNHGMVSAGGRGQHGWARSISADADHHVRIEVSQQLSSLEHCQGQRDHGLSPRERRDAIQSTDFDQLELISGG